MLAPKRCKRGTGIEFTRNSGPRNGIPALADCPGVLTGLIPLAYFTGSLSKVG
jgi:hypothetical protein